MTYLEKVNRKLKIGEEANVLIKKFETKMKDRQSEKLVSKLQYL